MSRMSQKEYLEAISTLKKWAKAYYTDDAPLATDAEYDELYHRILEFEEQNPLYMFTLLSAMILINLFIF